MIHYFLLSYECFYHKYAQGKGLGFAPQWRVMQLSDAVGKSHLSVKGTPGSGEKRLAEKWMRNSKCEINSLFVVRLDLILLLT